MIFFGLLENIPSKLSMIENRKADWKYSNIPCYWYANKKRYRHIISITYFDMIECRDLFDILGLDSALKS